MAVAFDGTAVAAGQIVGGSTLTLAKTTSGTNRVAVIGVAQQATTNKWLTVAYGAEGHAVQWAKAWATYPTTVAVLVNPPTASTNVVITFGGAATGGRVVISSFNGVSLSPVRQKGALTTPGGATTNFDCAFPGNMAATSIGVDMIGGYDSSTAFNATFMATANGTELNKAGAGGSPNILWAGAQYLAGTGGAINKLNWFMNVTDTVEADHAAVELKQTDSDTGQPRFTAAAAAVSGAGGTLFPTLPAHLTDDILVVMCESANQAVAVPSGYTEFTNSPQGSGTAAAIGAVRLHAFWKRATSAAETAPTVSAGTQNHTIVRIFGIRGCATSGNPFDATAGTTVASASSYTMPSVTTTVPDCLIAYLGGFDQDTATANILSVSSGGSLDSAVDKVIDSFTATGVGGGLGMFYGIKRTAGASGTIGVGAISAGTAAFLTIAFKGAGGAVNQVIVVSSLTTGVPALAPAAVTQNHVIDAQSLTAAAPTLAPSAVTQDHVVAASLTVPAPALVSGAVTVLQEYVVVAQSLTSGVPVFAPGTVSQLHTINVNALATAPPTLAPAAVTQRHVVVAQSLTTSVPVLVTGTIAQQNVAVAQNLATAAPVFVTGAVTQKHVVTASALTSAVPVLATGAVTQAQVIVAQSLATAAPVLVTGAVTQKQVAVAQPLATAAPVLVTGGVTQKHVAAVAALAAAAPTLAAGTVTQAHTTVAQSLATAAPVLVTGAVTQNHVAVVAALAAAAPTLVTGAVTQAATFPGSTLATAAPALVTGAVTQNHVVAASSLATAAPTLATGAATQVHVIAAVSLTTGVPVLAAGSTSGQIQVPAGALTTAAPVLGTGAVTQKHVAVVAALAAAAPTLATGAFSQQHAIPATALATAAPILATGAVSQKHVIVATSLVTAVPGLAASPLVVTLYMRPASDISAGGWTDQTGGTTGLYAAVADPSAANFIQSSTTPTADLVVIKAELAPSVVIQQPFVVVYEYGKKLANPTRIDITARLMQGGTEIAAWVHTDVSSTLTVAQQTLTGGQFAAISDFDALRTSFEANAP